MAIPVEHLHAIVDSESLPASCHVHVGWLDHAEAFGTEGLSERFALAALRVDMRSSWRSCYARQGCIGQRESCVRQNIIVFVDEMLIRESDQMAAKDDVA